MTRVGLLIGATLGACAAPYLLGFWIWCLTWCQGLPIWVWLILAWISALCANLEEAA